MTGTIEQLWAVYHEWKVLTEKEGLAIQQGDWPKVRKTQEEKQALQSRIIHLTDQVQAHLGSAIQDHQFDARLRGIVNELILLETQNNVTLQAALDEANEQKRDLDSTSARLRQLHTSYVPARRSVWENIS